MRITPDPTCHEHARQYEREHAHPSSPTVEETDHDDSQKTVKTPTSAMRFKQLSDSTCCQAAVETGSFSVPQRCFRTTTRREFHERSSISHSGGRPGLVRDDSWQFGRSRNCGRPQVPLHRSPLRRSVFESLTDVSDNQNRRALRARRRACSGTNSEVLFEILIWFGRRFR